VKLVPEIRFSDTSHQLNELYNIEWKCDCNLRYTFDFLCICALLNIMIHCGSAFGKSGFHSRSETPTVMRFF